MDKDQLKTLLAYGLGAVSGMAIWHWREKKKVVAVQTERDEEMARKVQAAADAAIDETHKNVARFMETYHDNVGNDLAGAYELFVSDTQ